MDGTGNTGMGGVIRRLRTERGWTQEALAEKLHLSPQAVSRWETGASLPDVSQIHQLARLFGVSTDTLYGLDGAEADEDDRGLALSPYSDVDPAAAYADWSRLTADFRAGDLGSNRSMKRWVFLALALNLADPGSCVYYPEKADEVIKGTLEIGGGFPEAEPREAWGMRAEYRRLLARLYALAGDRKAAFDMLGTERTGRPDQLTCAEDGETWRLLGDRHQERASLTTTGVQAVTFLLDALYACGDNALALGKPEQALEAADLALKLIPLFTGRKEGLISLQARERGDLQGLKARAHAALGEKDAALCALEEMTARRLRLLADGEERVEHVLFSTFGRGVTASETAARLLRHSSGGSSCIRPCAGFGAKRAGRLWRRGSRPWARNKALTPENEKAPAAVFRCRRAVCPLIPPPCRTSPRRRP